MDFLKILLLEDQPLDADLVEEALRRDGLSFSAARADTRAGFEALLADGPDLVLADYSLPGFSGLEALEISRRHRPDVPFILVSGAIGEERAIDAILEGATDYVLKNRLTRLGPAVRRALAEAEEKVARRRAEEELRRTLSELEDRVARRTAELATANRALAGAVQDRERLLAQSLRYLAERDEHQDRLRLHAEDNQRLLEELEAERARLDTVIRQMPAGVMIASASDGRIVLCNHQMQAIARKQMAVGEPLERVLHTLYRDEDGAPIPSRRCPLARALDFGEVVVDERLTIFRGDGTTATVSSSASPVRDRRGQIIGAVAVDVELALHPAGTHGPGPS